MEQSETFSASVILPLKQVQTPSEAGSEAIFFPSTFSSLKFVIIQTYKDMNFAMKLHVFYCLYWIYQMLNVIWYEVHVCY
jgi:hypothetical protein